MARSSTSTNALSVGKSFKSRYPVTISSPKTDQGSIPLTAVEASAENREAFLLGKKMIESGVESVQDTLRQLLTLATALLGGSIALTSDQLMPQLCKVATVACFLITLGISFWGMIPYAARISPNLPETVREARSKALEWKLSRLRWAGYSLIAGFVIAFAGLIVRSYAPIEKHQPQSAAPAIPKQ